jgi:hypothetical protein
MLKNAVRKFSPFLILLLATLPLPPEILAQADSIEIPVGTSRSMELDLLWWL